jgi:serine/threonine protein phosphatase PrpC
MKAHIDPIDFAVELPGIIDQKFLDKKDYRLETDPEKVEEMLALELEFAKEKLNHGQNPLFKMPKLPEREREGEYVIDTVTFCTGKELDVGIAATQGGRLSMEDTHLITTLTFQNVELKISALFDGHINGECSLHAKRHFKQCFETRLNEMSTFADFDLRLYNALKLSFVDISRLFRGAESGCTANVCVQVGNALFTANVGDSRAVLVVDGKAIPLSEDARPVIERFQKDIESRGGFVTEWGGVAHPMSPWMIAPARSLGDHHLMGAMNPRPKISKITLPKNSTLVQACDGLFDVASSKQVADLVSESTQDLEAAALELAAAAYLAGSEDNITVLVSKFS